MLDTRPLTDFVEWWRQYCRGDEKGEAQIFLDRLFTALGYPAGSRGAGGEPEMRVKLPTGEKPTTHFADLVIPGRALIEMKKRGEDLSKHQQQAFSYWTYLTPHPPYVILCNFDELWVYEVDRQVDDPMAKLPIANLPENWGPIAFLFPQPQAPVFNREFDLVELTEQAAASLSKVLDSLLRNGRGVEREHAQHFIMQCMLALFAEDILLLPQYLFTRLIEECQAGKSSYDEFFLLFTRMNQPGVKPVGKFYGVDYFDGGMFKQVYPVHLSEVELHDLREAANHNWARIRPAIFGRIFEASMDEKMRRHAGAHYTTERDILRIVEPVIIRPWLARITTEENANALYALHRELCAYRVLDPACGSGNFLYIAYREMKKLEQNIFTRLIERGAHPPPERVSARQFYGFDINPFAVELARVTLMIAKKLAVDELHSQENPLPLDDLDDNIRNADALFEPWPEFDACIGNPPYMGAKRLKQEYDAEYVNRVRAAFPDVPGNADYCVYWIRKAHELMRPGTRAGLVGTNTIRQNYSRIGGLDYVVDNGGIIFEAVSSIPWSGEANVHVSIACWSKGEPPVRPARLWLDGERAVEVPSINSALSPKTDVSGAKMLAVNTEPKRVFQGQTPGHRGFVLSPKEAHDLIHADPASKVVICAYLTGDDLLGEPRAQPSRYIIDFGARDVMETQVFSAAFRRIQTIVLPDREARAKAEQERNAALLKKNPRANVNHDHQDALEQWWLHFRSRVDRRVSLPSLSRFVTCSRVTKRPIFDFAHPNICPGDSLQTFAFDDDYSFGMLQSNMHWAWFTEKASTLKSDFRYTPDSVFDTFPFPQSPSPAQVKVVATAARALHEYRRQAMARSEKLTLRQMYRSLEMPGRNPLRELHEALNTAVLTAYGFDPNGDVLAQLLALNETVYSRIQNNQPVTAPGIPLDYSNPAELVSEGCITPPELI